MRFLTPKEALVRFLILMALGWLLIEAFGKWLISSLPRGAHTRPWDKFFPRPAAALLLDLGQALLQALKL
jgi:hypothetical protein